MTAAHRRIAAVRCWPTSAAARCAAYASCSDLLTSPHEYDPRSALAERHSALLALDYAQPLLALASALAELERSELAAQYSSLFEVGDDGPPVPIRESLGRGRSAAQREEVVRFYAHFGGDVSTAHAWEPDHAAIELEFMHLLGYRELHASSAADALPFQLAQLDFSTRHPGAWLPTLADDVRAARPDGLYARVVAEVAAFVSADLQWQRASVCEPADAAEQPPPPA